MRTVFDARRIRGIVFDLDGTLIDSYAAIAESLNHALSGLSLDPLPAAKIRTMVGRGLETLIDSALGKATTPEKIALGVRLFRERYDLVGVAGTTLLPGVAATLDNLAARGYRMAVATNKPSYFARRLLDALGAGGHFASVMGPDCVAHHKPHPEMVFAALAAIGLEADQALYVGDMEIDVETARNAGLPVVLVPTGSRTQTDLVDAGADLLIPAISRLLDLLEDPVPVS